MNIKHYFLILLLAVSTISWGQAVSENTNQKSKDAIQSESSLIGGLGNFIENNTSNEHLLVSLSDFNSSNWQNIKTISPEKTEIQAPPIDPANYPRYGVRLTQHFNYPILHTSPTSSVTIKNHNIYFGPEYNILLKKPSQDTAANWQPDHWGLNLGYRCHIKSDNKKINLFVQLNLSFYQVKYTEYKSGSIEPPTTHEKTTIENTGSLGLNYKLGKKIEIYGGLGFGSTNGFFLMFHNFIPHSFVGLGYKIN